MPRKHPARANVTLQYQYLFTTLDDAECSGLTFPHTLPLFYMGILYGNAAASFSAYWARLSRTGPPFLFPWETTLSFQFRPFLEILQEHRAMYSHQPLRLLIFYYTYTGSTQQRHEFISTIMLVFRDEMGSEEFWGLSNFGRYYFSEKFIHYVIRIAIIWFHISWIQIRLVIWFGTNELGLSTKHCLESFPVVRYFR